MSAEGPNIVEDGVTRAGRTIQAGEGWSLDLGHLELTLIAVNFQTRLRFEDVQVVIESPFEVHIAGEIHQLDPADRVGLGPLLGLYPDTLASATADGDGTLRIALESGAALVVPPAPGPYEPW